MVDSTHAVAVGGGTAFGGALAAVIAGTFHLDPTLAAAWVTVAAGIAGSIGGLAVWFVKWRFPSAPPLPAVTAVPAPGAQAR